jgi:hypothetical protein
MAKYVINIELTDAQDAVMQEMAGASGLTVEQTFQRFWDGYTSEGITMTGAIRAQVDQWITDRVKTELKKMDSAEALTKLCAITVK